LTSSTQSSPSSALVAGSLPVASNLLFDDRRVDAEDLAIGTSLPEGIGVLWLAHRSRDDLDWK